jgi:hypothetical protein
VAKKRKKSVAKKRKKQNLAGMDFASLVNLRTQVESALSGHRTTLEKQLAALGGSIASAWWKTCPQWARKRIEGEEGAAEVSKSRW